jgi:L,D-transpeptidase catalytic domain
MPRQTPLYAALLGIALLGAAATQARAGIVIEIDKATQQMTVSVDGQLRWQWPVSTGRAGKTTPAGSFVPFRLEVDHFSEELDDAPMPHSIFFTRIGHAIHGSYETRRLGTPASSGCVRLAPPNAEKLFALVKTVGLNNTKVVVSGTEPVVARGARPAPEVPAARQAPPLTDPVFIRRAPEPREPMILPSAPPPPRPQTFWPFN